MPFKCKCLGYLSWLFCQLLLIMADLGESDQERSRKVPRDIAAKLTKLQDTKRQSKTAYWKLLEPFVGLAHFERNRAPCPSCACDRMCRGTQLERMEALVQGRACSHDA